MITWIVENFSWLYILCVLRNLMVYVIFENKKETIALVTMYCLNYIFINAQHFFQYRYIWLTNFNELIFFFKYMKILFILTFMFNIFMYKRFIVKPNACPSKSTFMLYWCFLLLKWVVFFITIKGIKLFYGTILKVNDPF